MFFERPQSGERAVLVHLELGGGGAQEDPRELEELVLSAGGDPVEFVFGQRDRPDPGHFVGSGKLLEICLLYTSPSPRDGLLSRMPSSA